MELIKRTHSARLWKSVGVLHVPKGALDMPIADIGAKKRSHKANGGYDVE